ncbi:MAG: hypothetical protein SFY96_07340 [Planctomycetota bacterium]|nr:hypothetical protein [Planctomycetota bacterium]
MNWVAFALFSWVLLGLETSMRGTLALGDAYRASPSFVFPFAAFLAIAAPSTTARWSALLLGLLVDLMTSLETRDAGASITLLGPNALGYLLAAQLIIIIRALLFPRNPLSLGFVSFAGYLVAQIVVVALYTLRHRFDPSMVWEATPELVSRLLAALYTGGVAVLLGMLFIPFAGVLGLQIGSPRGRFARRGI